MARPSGPLKLSNATSESRLSSNSTSLAQRQIVPSPLEISQQLQRIDALHAQLKAETIRAQDFLLKLRRDEDDASSQIQSKANGRTGHSDSASQHHQTVTKEQKERDRLEKKMTVEKNGRAGEGHESHKGPHDANHSAGHRPVSEPAEALCKCSCPHHPPLSPGSEAKPRKSGGSRYLPLSLPAHVEEREVRDLEKRVRGLEGRVRGLEGLPPDREMALLEVERLRRELEGLAKRREGLFEGLCGDGTDDYSTKKLAKLVCGNGKAARGDQANAKVGTNVKGAGGGKR